MAILLVEDDHLQAGAILPVLEREFPGTEIRVIKTEHEFRRRLEEFVADPPDVIVMDVMIRWTKPSAKVERPPRDVAEGGLFRAGLRCARLFTQQSPGVPVIFYTILDYDDLRDQLPESPQFVYLPKQADQGPLIRQVRQFLDRTRPAPKR